MKDQLRNVTVIGAAGKMGSGISLLLAQEMAWQKLENPDNVYALYLVDPNNAALEGLWHYLRAQAVRTGEKQINRLRKLFVERKDLEHNEQMIEAYVHTVLSIIRPSTEPEVARNSNLVFEAAVEREELKINLFKKFKELCSPETYFFTNTSSIPISLLETEAALEGRIVGLHFYNPPAVQKLLEIIPSAKTGEELVRLAQDISAKLRKTVVMAKDVAGFIGNGHFIREGVFALQEVRRLEQEHQRAQAIYMVNKISQDFLLRPMGIFQLIDYVGIDVFQCIQQVMTKHLPGIDLADPLIDEMIAAGIRGGQHSNGTQKDGFFQYKKNRMNAVYDLSKKDYISFEQDNWSEKLDSKLGERPDQKISWKGLLAAPDKDEQLKNFFETLKGMNTLGAGLARSYMQQSEKIAAKLVEDGVAAKAEDVNTVLVTGFFHLYGPIGNYLS